MHFVPARAGRRRTSRAGTSGTSRRRAGRTRTVRATAVRGLAVGVCSLAVLAGCTSAPLPPVLQSQPAESAEPRESAPAGLQRFYDQKLAWQDCDGSFECADLTVPRDYANPEAGTTTIALLRAKGDKPQGSLVVNPGGPGGSGVDYARAAGQILSDTVTEQYSVVGFDPRGVGRSAPIDCLTDAELDEWIALDGEPDSQQEQQELLDAARDFGKACEERSAQMLPYVDTESVVKDLDILRAALGERRLNYLGFSYGTMIGALYADRFGPKTRRMVLDGALPPQLTIDEIGLGQAKGFDKALRRYVEDCQTKSDCPVAGESVDEGVRKVQDFLDSLDEQPLPAGDGRELNQGLGAGAVLYHLYFPFAGDWDSLSDGLRDAFAGDGRRLLDMFYERLERSPDGKYANNSQEVFYAVTCLDRGSDADIEKLRRQADEWAQEAPVFGRYLAWTEAACSEWPVAATGEPEEVTAADAGPILVIGNTNDPATPLEWAQLLADRLADAHLIVWESDGHTAYGNGSSCVDDAVDAYLVDGELPPADLVCR